MKIPKIWNPKTKVTIRQKVLNYKYGNMQAEGMQSNSDISDKERIDLSSWKLQSRSRTLGILDLDSILSPFRIRKQNHNMESENNPKAVPAKKCRIQNPRQKHIISGIAQS